jgi:hypothetical protein
MIHMLKTVATRNVVIDLKKKRNLDPHRAVIYK